ncbi:MULTISPECIES: DUF6011 domain-containing protein [Kitasatospora]|uniref:Uncharacterized protein n=1 Tax=Kitasatospora griseola TaxID=2064 RepID=A0A0D0NEB4_KITGR|nr:MULTISPECIES: DUF6011 domain-containing protein [Kitasatospora]KIQ66585.1 hypothetical protein TR51_03320 [Kitasatospora griseola]PJN28186.1 hypothetical protein CG736_08475 [Kitasatospora sp. CB02891]GGR02371.1 hypothetical protein GCM10010195_67590 [Kitasatospora griseola]
MSTDLKTVEPPLPGTAVERRPAPVVRCRRCHRPLHSPESRWEKLGRHCADAPERTRVYVIDQDRLPGT